ncbi:MAG: methylmalonyl-CoA mutase family protein [Candidatus Methylomirabilis oxyfera]|nr:methylmalonyl-CoA mutase family protein [Candidatus Methylomirabilis oxyfera]
MGNEMDVKKLQDARKAWEEETLKPTLERAKERVPEFTTPSGLPVKRLYTPEDAEGRDHLEAVGFPGQYPYTRGIYPTMYRGQFWTMRQYAGIGTAKESNERFRYLLKEGQTGLSVAFDLPTQMGLDSDHPLAAGEVGQVGVAIDSLRDMEVLFDGIPLERVTTSMTINAPASVLLALYVAVAEKQGVPLSKIAGTVQNDVLKEYVARGTHIFPPRPSLRLAADLIAYCADQVPRWNPISISGYHMREAGASAVKEIAFTFANAIAYVEAAQRRGLAVDAFAPRISWIFNTHNHFFEEIAKYRTLRRMWAKIMRERFGAKDPRSWMLRTHTQTGGSTLMAQQPENNIIRAAIQALAAVLGGVQSMALSCFDEALALPTEQAQRIALRTQQIIAYESGAADTVDPMAGSYYVEALTDELERRATEELEAIEATGGAVEAIERGYMQQAIQEEAYAHQQEVESGTRVVVGVNRFQDEGRPQPLQLYRTDPEAENAQVRGLEALRRERDNRPVQAALARLREVALGEDNLLPPILQAVKAYGTVGEICGVLREVFGEYKAPTGL